MCLRARVRPDAAAGARPTPVPHRLWSPAAHARLCIERIRGQDVEGDREIRFDDIRVNAAGQETIEVVFADAAGDRVRLVLPRSGLKELVSWKTLLSL